MTPFRRLIFIYAFPAVLVFLSCTPNKLTTFKNDRQSEQSPFFTKIAGMYNLVPGLKDSIILLQINENGNVFWWHEQSRKIVECQIGAWKLQDSGLSLLHGQNMFPELPSDSFGTSIFGPNGSIQNWHILSIDTSGITAKTNGKNNFTLKKENRSPTGLEQKNIDLLSDPAFQKRLAGRRKESIRKEQVKHLIEQRRFLMAADFITDNNRPRFPVPRELNYILVDSLNGCLQSGSSWGRGKNRVGGITVDGLINEYKVKEKRSKSGASYLIKFSIMTNYWGLLIIRMSVEGNGNASAYITGGTLPGHFVYTGELVPADDSFIFKGRSW
jgi:hypothetical protein